MIRQYAVLILGLAWASAFGCRAPDPVRTPEIDQIIGASAFSGRWQCERDRVTDRRLLQQAGRSCRAEQRDSASLSALWVKGDAGGRLTFASRLWGGSDSVAWRLRSDSIQHALASRVRNATPCQLPTPDPHAGRGVEAQAWRLQDYVLVLTLFSTQLTRGGLYQLKLELFPTRRFPCKAPEATLHETKATATRSGQFVSDVLWLASDLFPSPGSSL